MVYLFQALNTQIILYNILYMDNVGGLIINQTCFQFDILSYKFMTMNNDVKRNGNGDKRLMLHSLITQHQDLITYVINLEIQDMFKYSQKVFCFSSPFQINHRN